MLEQHGQGRAIVCRGNERHAGIAAAAARYWDASTIIRLATYSPSMGVSKRRTRTSLIRRPMVVSTVNRRPSIDT